MSQKNSLPKLMSILAMSSAMLLSACSSKTEDVSEKAVDKAEQSAAEVKDMTKDAAKTAMKEKTVTEMSDIFSREPLAKSIEILASDEFEGRAPNSAGEEKTIAYIAGELKAAGFDPAVGDSYYQKVPLVSITPKEPKMSFSVGGKTEALKLGENSVLWTKRVVEKEAIADSPLVFVGYGVVAPEYDWNDYAGIDMTGKTAVILVNDPGFATQDDALFTGNAMTYYGRWTYKYEEAARQGAAGAIVVHETAPAGYPWEVVSGSWTGPSFSLVAADNNMSRANVESWISHEAAEQLFKDAGVSYSELKSAAAKKGFKPVELKATVSASMSNELEKIDSMNVVGVLPGAKKPDEYVIYMGHWDHLGKDETREGDQIYNGAVDNASGTAAILQIAKAFGQQEQRPERSIVAILVTAEEQGLLGSKHYGENPVFPLNRTIGGINIDAMNVHEKTENVTIVGYGASELEDYVKDIAKKQGRGITPDQSPEKGYFYRSDHFSLSKVGVPMIYAGGSGQFIGKSKEYGDEITKDYVANRYHKVGDEFDPNWSLEGTLQDIDLYFELGQRIANDGSYPNWYEGNEFRSNRDKSLATP